jgi:hypothetical protein
VDEVVFVGTVFCSLAARSSVAGFPVSLFWLLSTLKYTKLNGSAQSLVTRRNNGNRTEDQQRLKKAQTVWPT